MIQRIQSIYLLLATIACVVCMSLPIGEVVADLHGATKVMNLFAVLEDGTKSYAPCGLFIQLLIVSTLNFMAIFGCKNRKLQMRVVSFTALLTVLYYGVLAMVAHMLCANVAGADFKSSFTLCLPLVAVVLDVMAVRAIRRDEKLVRSLDRIR